MKSNLINKITCVHDRTRHGVIKSVFIEDGVKFAEVHYLDFGTGELVNCPNKKKCDHRRGCSFHGTIVETSKLDLWDTAEINMAVEEGMLVTSIADAALKTKRAYAC